MVSAAGMWLEPCLVGTSADGGFGVPEPQVPVLQSGHHQREQCSQRYVPVYVLLRNGTQPQLEIYTDDVKCSHAMGNRKDQLDENYICFICVREELQEKGKPVCCLCLRLSVEVGNYDSYGCTERDRLHLFSGEKRFRGRVETDVRVVCNL